MVCRNHEEMMNSIKFFERDAMIFKKTPGPANIFCRNRIGQIT